MNKKKFILIILLIFISITKVYAQKIDKKTYSIEPKETYNEVAKDTYLSDGGKSFNIVIQQLEAENLYDKNIYNDNNLEILKNEIKNSFNNYLDEIKTMATERFKNILSDDEIKKMLDNIKVNDIITAEITTAGKNNYKCFHFIIDYSMDNVDFVREQFMFITKDQSYILTISDDNREIINSFEIKNYKNISIEDDEISKYEKNIKIANIAEKICYIIFVLGVIVFIIGLIIYKKKKR